MAGVILVRLPTTALLFLVSLGSAAAENATRCGSDAVIRQCPSVCLPACEDSAFYVRHSQACRDIAALVPDPGKEPQSCRKDGRSPTAAVPSDDRFPSCTANVDTLRRAYHDLAKRSEQAGIRYKELIERGYSKIVEICDIPHQVLLKDLETAQSTDADVQQIREEYDAVNDCYNKVMDWFNNYDLSLVELGPEVRQRLLKSVSDSVASLSLAREKFETDLQTVRNARNTLQQLRALHYRACGERTWEQ